MYCTKEQDNRPRSVLFCFDLVVVARLIVLIVLAGLISFDSFCFLLFAFIPTIFDVPSSDFIIMS